MITIANKLDVLSILFSPVSTTVNNRCSFINAEQHYWNNNEQHCSAITVLLQHCCRFDKTPPQDFRTLCGSRLRQINGTPKIVLTFDKTLFYWYIKINEIGGCCSFHIVLRICLSYNFYRNCFFFNVDDEKDNEVKEDGKVENMNETVEVGWSQFRKLRAKYFKKR